MKSPQTLTLSSIFCWLLLILGDVQGEKKIYNKNQTKTHRKTTKQKQIQRHCEDLNPVYKDVCSWCSWCTNIKYSMTDLFVWFGLVFLLCRWSCFEDLFHRDLTDNISSLKSVQYKLLKGRQLFTAPSGLAGWVPAAHCSTMDWCCTAVSYFPISFKRFRTWKPCGMVVCHER